MLILQGWIFYAQSEFKHVPEKLHYLRSVTELALTCLEYHVEDAMDLVAEVLENYPSFFEAKHQEMLWSAIAGPWGLEILRDLDAETVSLARIIVAYGQIQLDAKTLYREHEAAHNQQVMCKLTLRSTHRQANVM
jgi:predicted PolB exonuclease-like 3'-5' exonuclease